MPQFRKRHVNTKQQGTIKMAIAHCIMVMYMFHATAEAGRRLCSSDFKLVEDKPNAVWALDYARATTPIALEYSKKNRNKEIMDSFGAFYKQPKPEANCCLNFDDSCYKLRFDVPPAERLQAVDKSPANDCYKHIPVSLEVKPSDDSVERLECFLATGFAGDEEARDIDCAMEAIPYYGKHVPHVQVFLVGAGGNAKSARSALRHNFMGGSMTALSSL